MSAHSALEKKPQKVRCQLLCECCCGAHRFACDMYSRFCIHTRSFTHSFMHSFFHSCMHSLTHSRTHALSHFTSRTHSLHALIYFPSSLTGLFFYSLLTRSVTHSLIHSFTYSFTYLHHLTFTSPHSLTYHSLTH